MNLLYTPKKRNGPQDFSLSLSYVARIKIRFGKKKRIKTAQPVGEEKREKCCKWNWMGDVLK
jgi:hypothetical protein